MSVKITPELLEKMSPEAVKKIAELQAKIDMCNSKVNKAHCEHLHNLKVIDAEFDFIDKLENESQAVDAMKTSISRQIRNMTVEQKREFLNNLPPIVKEALSIADINDPIFTENK